MVITDECCKHGDPVRKSTVQGYFLDSVCDEIFEIDWNGETFIHPGSWETFLKRRAERAWTPGRMAVGTGWSWLVTQQQG